MSEYQMGSDGGSQSAVAQAQEKVQEKAQQATGTAMRAVREQVETRAGQASTELQSVAGAMRRSGHSLRADGNESSAKTVDAVTDRMEGLAHYLGGTSGDRMLADVESFGRRQPWAMIGAGLTLGFLASRFLKASSTERYESGVPGRALAPHAPAVLPPAPPAPRTPSTATPPQTVGSPQVSGW